MATTMNLNIPYELKERLQYRVEEISFIDKYFKLNGFTCCACGKVAINHLVANCGDVFCDSCFSDFDMEPCPSCGTTVESCYVDTEFEAAVFQLQVRCQFSQNGCKQIVSLRNYWSHSSVCNFSIKNILTKENKHQLNEILPSMQTENLQNNNESWMGEIRSNEELLGKMQSFEMDKNFQMTRLWKLTDETEQMQDEIWDLETAMEDKHKFMKVLRKHDKNKIQKIRVKLQSKLQKVTKKNKTAMKLMQENNRKQLEEIKEKHKQEMQMLRTEHGKLLEELKTMLDVEIGNLHMLDLQRERRMKALETQLTELQIHRKS